MPSNFIDLTGKVFGEITVLYRVTSPKKGHCLLDVPLLLWKRMGCGWAFPKERKHPILWLYAQETDIRDFL